MTLLPSELLQTRQYDLLMPLEHEGGTARVESRPTESVEDTGDAEGAGYDDELLMKSKNEEEACSQRTS